MIEITGTETLPLEPARVLAGLADLELLARAIPGLSRVDSNDGTTLVCRVRPGLSFLSGSLRNTIRREEEADGESVRYRVDSKGIGAGARVAAHLRCTAADAGGCRVDWSTHVEELSGLLKPVGASLVEAAMGKVIRATWEGIRAKLAALDERPPDSPACP